MKKILPLAIAAAALVSTADAKGFNGFYAGMDLGLSNLNSTYKLRNSESGDYEVARNVHGHALNPVLGITLGYNQTFSNCLSLGAEFISDFNFSNRETLLRTENEHISSKRKTYSWGLLAKFGTLITPKSMAFVGFGIKSQNVSYRFWNAATVAPTPEFSFAFRNKKIRPAYQIGFKNLVAGDCVSLHMTYTFVQGSKKTKNNIQGDGFLRQDADVETASASAKNNEHQVKIGASYHF